MGVWIVPLQLLPDHQCSLKGSGRIEENTGIEKSESR